MFPPRAQTSATIALGMLGRLKPCSPSLRPLSMPGKLSPSSTSMQTGWWYCPIKNFSYQERDCSCRHQPPQLLLREGGLIVEGCSGDDAELRAPANGFGVTLFGVELVHVPGIDDRAEDA